MLLSSSKNNNLIILNYSKVLLEYSLSDLQPVISRETMNQHYNVHYDNYIKGLNEAYLRHGVKSKIISVLKNPNKYPKELVDNAGGYVNHSIYFQCLKHRKETPNIIPENIKKLMIRDYSSEKEFMNYFIGMGKRVFGSGWVWWCLQSNGLTSIATTQNQDTPYSDNLYPILGVDVWEHSYYLDYKADRLLYLNNIWKIINWSYVQKRLFNNFNNNPYV